MLIKVGEFDCTEVWDGILYKKLSNYPQVSDWEIRTLLEFINYEEKNGRVCTIECEDEMVLKQILGKVEQREVYLKLPPPHLLTECTVCPYRKGCVTEFVCYTASVGAAVKYLNHGWLWPEDFSEHITFQWGNCQEGDCQVMERELGRFPNVEDLCIRFRPGIRFYFRYEKINRHPDVVFDGISPVKVRGRVDLAKWIHRIVIPAERRGEVEKYVPDILQDKILYIENDCRDIWEWSEKVYRRIEKL